MLKEKLEALIAEQSLKTDVPSDVFSYLARFLPKSMDVLWVVQELDAIRRLNTLSQREQASRDLYLKMEQRIVSSGQAGLGTAELRKEISTQFSKEATEGFLKPLFSSPAPAPVQPPQPKQLKQEVINEWKFGGLKKFLADSGKEPLMVQLKLAGDKLVPISLKGSAWRKDIAGGRRGYVISLKDLSEARQYMQQRLSALTQALRRVRSGDFTALLAFEAKSGDLKEYVDAVKELIYDREDKIQEIDRLRQEAQAKEQQLKTKITDIEQVTKKLQEVRDHLQTRAAELERAKQAAVEREFKLQQRVLELEQAKKTAVEHELTLQQHIAELEVAKREAVERELALQARVAELEQAKQTGVEKELQVERLKRRFEEFYRDLDLGQ